MSNNNMIVNQLRAKTENKKVDVELQRENTFSRKSTFNRTFTTDGGLTRTFTEQVMKSFDPDEQYTRSIITEYIKMSEKGNEGDIPLPAGFANKPEFWKLMFIAGSFGAVMAFVGIAFITFTDNMPKQWVTCDYENNVACSDYYNGELYYIYIVACTGIVIGLIRWSFDYPFDLPGLFKEINDCHVNPDYICITYLISALSLSGGATLGPEAALGAFGGGLATWFAEKVEFKDENDKKLVVLSGMSGALGGLFPTPLLATLMLHELGDPPKQYMESIIILSFAAVVCFMVYYQMVDYESFYLNHASTSSAQISLAWLNEGFELWQCLTGFMIGVTSAALCIMIIMTVGLTKQIFNRIRTKLEFNSFLQHVVPPMIGGIIIGTVNWALPLTCGNGQDLLGVIIKNGANGSYNVPLLLRTGFARMLLLGVSLNSGFIGGLIFPMLTMASCAGTVMYQYYDYVPLGLCVGGFMIGIPCGICPMPFTFLLLICFIFYFGLYQTAPLFIVAITSYSIVCGSGFLKRLQDRQVEMSNAKATEEDNDLRAQKDLEKQEADQFAIKQYLGSRNFKVSVAENPINL